MKRPIWKPKQRSRWHEALPGGGRRITGRQDRLAGMPGLQARPERRSRQRGLPRLWSQVAGGRWSPAFRHGVSVLGRDPAGTYAGGEPASNGRFLEVGPARFARTDRAARIRHDSEPGTRKLAVAGESATPEPGTGSGRRDGNQHPRSGDSFPGSGSGRTGAGACTVYAATLRTGGADQYQTGSQFPVGAAVSAREFRSGGHERRARVGAGGPKRRPARTATEGAKKGAQSFAPRRLPVRRDRKPPDDRIFRRLSGPALRCAVRYRATAAPGALVCPPERTARLPQLSVLQPRISQTSPGSRILGRGDVPGSPFRRA